MHPPNLKSVALPVPEIRGVAKVANPQLWGRGGRRGSGMVQFERALVSFYRPSIVTFPLSGMDFRSVHASCCDIAFTRFRDIAAFVLQNAIFPDPTS